MTRPSHRLSDVRTRELVAVRDRLIQEIGWCDEGYEHEQRGAWLALAWLVQIELSHRDPRRRPDARLVALTKGGRR